MVYALPIPIGFNDYDICHLEMINIVVTTKTMADLLSHWSTTSDLNYKLQQLLPKKIWIPVHPDLLLLNNNI